MLTRVNPQLTFGNGLTWPICVPCALDGVMHVAEAPPATDNESEAPDG